MTAPMTIIYPIPVTSANLISSNIPETEFPTWASNTDYLSGESIIKDNRVWLASKDAQSNAVFNKRFKNDGTAGSAFVRSTYSRALAVSVASMPNGDYVVAYIENDTSLPMLIRYNSAGLVQGQPVQIAIASATHISVTGLVDNQIVVAYRFVSGTNNGITFVRLSATGVVTQTVNIVTSVTATTSYNSVSVGRLIGGNFVVFYTTSVGNVTSFAQYTAAGAISGTITSVVAANGNYASVSGLTNGNFALAYTNSANQPTRAVYSTANAVVAASATVATVTSTYTDVSSIGTGDFVVVYIDSTNGNSVRFQRYTAAGAAAGAITVVTGLSSNYSKISNINNNQFIVAYYTNSDFIPRFARYNSTGVLQGDVVTVQNTQVSSVCLSGLPNGQFIVSCSDSLSADPLRVENQNDLWIDTGPTNRFAALDLSGGTITKGVDTIEYVISAPSAQAVAFLDISASSVRVYGFSPSIGGFYDKIFELPDQISVTNWQQYFDEPIRRKKEVIVTDIPRVADAIFTIQVLGSVNTEAGSIVLGTFETLNFVEYGATAGIIDYSRKVTDEFGKTTLVKRAFAKRADVRVILNPDQVDNVQRSLAQIRATPAVFVCTPNQYEALTIFGFYREFSIDIAYPSLCYCSISIEGLT